LSSPLRRRAKFRPGGTRPKKHLFGVATARESRILGKVTLRKEPGFKDASGTGNGTDKVDFGG
jgi:hypothetical protein